MLEVNPGERQPDLNGRFTDRARKAMELANREAQRLNHEYIGTEHILLGLLREQEGVAAQVLINVGLRLDDVRHQVLNVLATEFEHSPVSKFGPIWPSQSNIVLRFIRWLRELFVKSSPGN